MRRIILISVAVVLTLIAVAARADSVLPLEATVPDAAAVRISDTGFDFISGVATNLLSSYDLAGMLYGLNPLFTLNCTNLLFIYVELVANITEVHMEEVGAQISTTPLMGLTPVNNAIYVGLSLAPGTGNTLLEVSATGTTGSNDCGEQPLNASAAINMDSLELAASATINYTPGGKGLEVVLEQVKVNFNGFDIVLTGFPAGLDDLIEGLLTTQLTQLLEELAPALINQLLQEQLGNIVLEGEITIGDYTMVFAMLPSFETGDDGLTVTADGKLYVEGTTLDPCIDDGSTPGSPYTDNPLPDFGLLTPGGDPYHFALALSDDILNQLLYSFFAKGDFCLMFPWELDDNQPLTLAAFAGLLPGWEPPGDLIDAANLIDMYPLDIPRFEVGGTETDLALVMQPYHLDWYIQAEDRYVAMLNADIYLNLALSMSTDANNNLIITLEGTSFEIDLQDQEWNILPPDIIEAALNGIINLVLPLIVDIIPPLPLPQLLGYQFVIHEIGSMGSGDDYFGLYCEFVAGDAKGPEAAFVLPHFGRATDLSLTGAQSARAGLSGVTHPALHLDGSGAQAIDHYLVRVDGGFWQTVTDNVFDLSYYLDGAHTVEILAVAPSGLRSARSARLAFVLDRVAPRIDRAELKHKGARTLLELAAHDYVAASSDLRFQLRLADSGWSKPFAATSVSLDQWPLGTGALQVRAIDPSGNAGEPFTIKTSIRR